MNTDTPETGQWEAYCDECYYHMWRLRRKTERGWHDGFHIHTGEEAKGLCEILNNLERERDEARGQRDRLEEALTEAIEGRHGWRVRAAHLLASGYAEALQSLTPNEP